MRIYHVRAKPVGGNGPAAAAFVVADDEAEVMALLRKDISFSGYRVPPDEVELCEATADEVRRALGTAAAHEVGVYGFTVLGTADPEDAGTPPAAMS